MFGFAAGCSEGKGGRGGRWRSGVSRGFGSAGRGMVWHSPGSGMSASSSGHVTLKPRRCHEAQGNLDDV